MDYQCKGQWERGGGEEIRGHAPDVAGWGTQQWNVLRLVRGDGERMKTICIQIGNSDNKLTQTEWSDFVAMVGNAILAHDAKVHFFGGAPTWERWQNVCWVIDCPNGMVDFLRATLQDIRERYRQESVGYLEGETEFL